MSLQHDLQRRRHLGNVLLAFSGAFERPLFFEGSFKSVGNSGSQRAFSFTVMSERFEDQPWYADWKKTVDRVVTARMVLDSMKPRMPEWEAAEREYQAALAAFRSAAEQFQKS